MNEITTKLQKVRAFLEENRYSAAIFSKRTSFAWISGGKDAHIALGSEFAVAGILVTRKAAYLLTNTIEAPRIYAEEISKGIFKPVIFPWYEREEGEKLLRKIAGNGTIVSESGEFNTRNKADQLARLRWQLLPPEIERYRDLGMLASNVMEKTCFKIKPGITEWEIAARLSEGITSAGALPFVVLVATDERIKRFRHPTPQPKKLKKHAMLVICAMKHGLIANLTRLVYFGRLPSELRKKHQAVCYVDIVMNLATQPGKTGAEIFKEGMAAYRDQGFANEWKLHHQGGATGYAGREWFGTPTTREKVLENQAFAWNPSITGTKSEDTILVRPDGMEILTPTSSRWPMVHFHHPDGCIERPDILVR